MRDCSWVLNNFRYPNIHPSNFTCSSDRTEDQAVKYNCIAWAVETSKNRWWWPLKLGGYHWPKGLPYELPNKETIDNFVAAFATMNFVECPDASFEDGFEKIALYVDAKGVPKHAARLLPSGSWTSKLGDWEDIEHPSLDVMEGPGYGEAKKFFKRKI
jgi:hypothetical protein